jgi:hypothetical protein
MANPYWNTTAGSIGSFTENTAMSYTFSATAGDVGDTLSYTKLNGTIPTGLTLSSSGVLSGTPTAVNSNVVSEFTIRVTESNNKIADRTFSMTVTGATAPTWTTPAGALPIGPASATSINDSTWIEYQVVAQSNDPDTTVIITLASGSSLPQGLEIDATGLIRGYALPPTTATATTTFTLNATTVSGTTGRTFTITILNQELNYVGVFPGRAPAILNDQPLTFVISPTDPFYSYYTDGSTIGRYDQSNDFIFKMIGYNFDAVAPDEDPYEYDLSYSLSGVTPNSDPTLSPFNQVSSPDSPYSSDPTGWINGVLSTVGTSIRSYSIDVTVSRISDPTLASDTKTFTLIIVGTITDEIIWTTPANLESIDNGAICDLAIEATFGYGVTDGQYRLVGGNLPPGLQILSNGNISGRVEFDLDPNDNPYVFTVEAYSAAYPTLITSTREFTLAVVQKYSQPYDTIYMQGLLSLDDRSLIDNLLQNISYTQSVQKNNIYRPTDSYFGVAEKVVYQHQFGVPSVSATAAGNDNYFYEQYLAAVQRNFYWKYLTLGTLKTAIAKDSVGRVIYDVVYSEIIDNLVNNEGVSISKKVGFPNGITTNIGPYWTSWTTMFTSNTYYDVAPVAKAVMASASSSFTLVVNNVNNLVVGMQLTGFPGVTIVNEVDGTPPVLTSFDSGTNTVTLSVAQTISNKQQIIFNNPVSVSNTDAPTDISLYPNSLPNMREQIAEMIGQFENSTLLPRWMDSQQSNGSVIGFVPCWVLCYTKPGKSSEVLSWINTYLENNSLTLNQISFEVDRIEVDRSLTYTWGETNFDQWPVTAPPSTSVNDNSKDSYINFPRKTILY